MKIFQESSPNIYTIRSFANGIIKINEESFSRSLIVTGNYLETNWPITHVGELDQNSFKFIDSLAIDVLLIGTGKTLCFPEPEVFEPLRKKRIGYEIMDTAAACRTYNVIVNDGRKVGAALILESM